MKKRIDVDKLKDQVIKDIRWELLDQYAKLKKLGYKKVIITPFPFEDIRPEEEIRFFHNSLISKEDVVL